MKKASCVTIYAILLLTAGCGPTAEEDPNLPQLNTTVEEPEMYDTLEELDPPADLRDVKPETAPADPAILDPFGDHDPRHFNNPPEPETQYVPAPPGLEITEPIPVEEVRPFMLGAAPDSPNFRVYPPTLEELEADLPSISRELQPLEEELETYEPEPIRINLKPTNRDQPTKLPVSRSSDPLVRMRDRLEYWNGTVAVERAIERSLRWLADHQLNDGSWSFDLTKCKACKGQCEHSGTLNDAPVAATALALLPFLEVGYSDQEGAYKKTVAAGLAYLRRKMTLVGDDRGTWPNDAGGAYTHAMATTALCEAYGLTRGKEMPDEAQRAINHIDATQNPDGGWSVSKDRESVMSLTVLHTIALKAGHCAYLRIDSKIVKKIPNFLDKVQSDDGAKYGETGPADDDPTATAAGVLCRSYLGWGQDEPEKMHRAADHLLHRGPTDDIYINYHVTHLMNWLDDDYRRKWNDQLRKRLIVSQASAGHQTGSWYFADSPDRGKPLGGRLYHTVMAALTLEVYYQRPIPHDYMDFDFEE